MWSDLWRVHWTTAGEQFVKQQCHKIGAHATWMFFISSVQLPENVGTFFVDTTESFASRKYVDWHARAKTTRQSSEININAFTTFSAHSRSI
jgi:hypothetical protein